MASSSQNQIPVGTDVYASDGDKLGTVNSAGADYVVVEKGFLFPTDYYIPTGSFSRVEDGKAYLTVTKDEAVGTTSWSQQPSSDSWSATATAVTDFESTTTGGGDHLRTNERTDLRDDDNLVVSVHEEELVASKREREAGEVIIRKDIVEEQRTIEVPITEERVAVTRRVVDREATVGEVAFEGGTIEVPLTTEEVQLGKRVKVSEEIEIDREQVQTTQSVSGTVRKEIVDVDETTAVQTGSRTYRDDDRASGANS